MGDIGSRKEDHLELCATGEVGHTTQKTLLDEVTLVHSPLPEIALDQVDTSCELLGKKLTAPVLISAMTGGTERTGTINRELAEVAERLGIGFALGSQRPMARDETVTWTYAVRKRAPTALVLGNLGLWQARRLGPGAVEDLCRNIGADAMAIHLNPAQELIQPEGDRDFKGGLTTLSSLQEGMGLPLIVKETGCGLGPRTARLLRDIGVEHLDVAGAGGTSWIAVETHRATSDADRRLGECLRDWGVPTAASVAHSVKQGFTTVIASGGITNGLEAAQALALGASAVGIARPILKVYFAGGAQQVQQYLEEVIHTLRVVMLLTSCAQLDDLRSTSRVIGPELERWLSQLDA